MATGDQHDPEYNSDPRLPGIHRKLHVHEGLSGSNCTNARGKNKEIVTIHVEKKVTSPRLRAIPERHVARAGLHLQPLRSFPRLSKSQSWIRG